MTFSCGETESNDHEDKSSNAETLKETKLSKYISSSLSIFVLRLYETTLVIVEPSLYDRRCVGIIHTKRTLGPFF